MLKEYILVDSETVGIECFRLNKQGHWELEEYQTINDAVELPTLQCSLPVREIYDGTKLME
jgi:Uma2 family endonuclease